MQSAFTRAVRRGTRQADRADQRAGPGIDEDELRAREGPDAHEAAVPGEAAGPPTLERGARREGLIPVVGDTPRHEVEAAGPAGPAEARDHGKGPVRRHLDVRGRRTEEHHRRAAGADVLDPGLRGVVVDPLRRPHVEARNFSWIHPGVLDGDEDHVLVLGVAHLGGQGEAAQAADRYGGGRQDLQVGEALRIGVHDGQGDRVDEAHQHRGRPPARGEGPPFRHRISSGHHHGVAEGLSEGGTRGIDHVEGHQLALAVTGIGQGVEASVGLVVAKAVASAAGRRVDGPPLRGQGRHVRVIHLVRDAGTDEEPHAAVGELGAGAVVGVGRIRLLQQDRNAGIDEVVRVRAPAHRGSHEDHGRVGHLHLEPA